MLDPTERFWTRVAKTETCWIWVGRTRKGYGQFDIDGGSVEAHRYAYELLVGPIPDGLTLDHVEARGCTSKACVNPAHLEPVTQGANARRWFSGHARPRCPRGHDMTDSENVYFERGHRRCRQCRREWRHEHYVQTGR